MSKPILALGAIAAAITAAWALLARIGPLLRKAAHFIDDVAGEPARPGQPARPGLMERVAVIEADAASAKANTEPNGGSSSHDQIMRAMRRIEDAQARQRDEFRAYARVMRGLHEETTALAAEHGFTVPPWPWSDLPPEEHT